MNKSISRGDIHNMLCVKKAPSGWLVIAKHLYFKITNLLYDDGDTKLSGGCLFTFGFTLLTCFVEFNI